MGALGLGAFGREQIETAAAIDRFARLADRIVDRGGLVTMRDAPRQPLRRQRRANHCPAIVENFDQIVLANAALLRVVGVHARDPVIIAIDIHPMVLNIEYERILAVTLGVERIFGVRREQLQRITREQLAGMRALPGWFVFDDRRPFRIIEALKRIAFKFEFAGLGLQSAEEFFGIVRRQGLRFRYVFLAVFVEPAERYRRAQLLLFRRHNEIAAP